MTTTTQVKPCTPKDIQKKFANLNRDEMIRIANKEPIYVGFNADQRCITLWNDAGYKKFGSQDIAGDVLYFAVTENYTKIILIDKSFEDKFSELVALLRAACLTSDENQHAQLFKHAFDIYTFK